MNIEINFQIIIIFYDFLNCNFVIENKSMSKFKT